MTLTCSSTTSLRSFGVQTGLASLAKPLGVLRWTLTSGRLIAPILNSSKAGPEAGMSQSKDRENAVPAPVPDWNHIKVIERFPSTRFEWRAAQKSSDLPRIFDPILTYRVKFAPSDSNSGCYRNK